MKEYFSKNSSKISYFPVFPTLAKFGVFPRTVITGNYRWEFPPTVFPGQPWKKDINTESGWGDMMMFGGTFVAHTGIQIPTLHEM